MANPNDCYPARFIDQLTGCLNLKPFPQPGDPGLLSDTGYVQLLGLLQQEYHLTTEKVQFSEKSFCFTRVTNPDDLPLDLNEEGQLKWQPYWAEDWQSSRALCRLVLERKVRNQSILDLGCGLGLTAAVAACEGAAVTLADNAQPALLFSEINCWRWKENCRFELLDWKEEHPALGRYDIILGAEIIYDSQDWNDLERFWKNHVARGGRVLLCDPFRRTGKEFREWILGRNWEVNCRDLKIPEFPTAINVIELSPGFQISH